MQQAQRRTPMPITPSVWKANEQQVELMLTTLDQAELDSEQESTHLEIKRNADTLYDLCREWFELRLIDIIYDEDIHGWRVREPGEE